MTDLYRQLNYLFGAYAINVHLLETFQEVGVGHHSLGWLPRYLLYALHHHNTLTDSLHWLWRLGERPGKYRNLLYKIHKWVWGTTDHIGMSANTWYYFTFTIIIWWYNGLIDLDSLFLFLLSFSPSLIKGSSGNNLAWVFGDTIFFLSLQTNTWNGIHLLNHHYHKGSDTSWCSFSSLNLSFHLNGNREYNYSSILVWQYFWCGGKACSEDTTLYLRRKIHFQPFKCP